MNKTKGVSFHTFIAIIRRQHRAWKCLSVGSRHAPKPHANCEKSHSQEPADETQTHCLVWFLCQLYNWELMWKECAEQLRFRAGLGSTDGGHGSHYRPPPWLVLPQRGTQGPQSLPAEGQEAVSKIWQSCEHIEVFSGKWGKKEDGLICPGNDTVLWSWIVAVCYEQLL